ncbi:phospholipid-translocating P-type ATPase, flippase [Nitzschia inconspicua]|uniref:P-type sodium-transporting ATPase4 n=1 Tax=Nitzschia inconspicua TaxID=303405 RepID=A0A9K3KNK7_9STRA|nr:phospholipid-translocating P-type ATPase, flippase [Nitzschia inconspicua]
MGLALTKPHHEEGDRVLVAGRPNYNRCDNMIVTSKYTAWSFLPVAVGEQFRRFANMYFLIVGIIMAIGYYSNLYESAISPWTTLGPLAFVISVSLLVEGLADMKRHQSDDQTNNAICVVLRRRDEIDEEEGATRDETILGGKDVIVNLSKEYFQTSSNQTPPTPKSPSFQNKTKHLAHIGFQQIKRMDIRQGHIVFIKNREMVPADIILLASSGDNGCAYIETSSIDGETNLKLRNSPHLPPKLLKHLRDGTPMDQIPDEPDDEGPVVMETVEQATKRVTRFSSLAYPEGISAVDHPEYKNKGNACEGESKRNILGSVLSPKSAKGSEFFRSSLNIGAPSDDGKIHYIAALTSEPPNPHVNTFSGKLTLPPVEPNGNCIDIPLGAENILLRGAVLRNTEWAIGLSCFTGTDTKLVQNSFQTPSKFSQLDKLMNKCVAIIIMVMVLCISYLATSAVIQWDRHFDELWYIGFKRDTTGPWPYLQGLESIQWSNSSQNWFQMFFLYVTLLSNFVPLSMYVTVEMINFFFLWLMYVDMEIYDAKTDTRAVARSTNVTDLGQVQYIFSDKTGTLTQNVMRFKRCSVDGTIFGPPVQKARPDADALETDLQSAFHPLRQLLVGHVTTGDDGTNLTPSKEMTFNAEMFLRVMSLCHTVVVEKDLDLKDSVDDAKSVSSAGSSWSAKNYAKKFFPTHKNRDRTTSDMSAHSGNMPLEPVSEEPGQVLSSDNNRSRAVSTGSTFQSVTVEKGPDGAPAGFAYQAESPDEGALVSEASKCFGFQVIGRDSSGIKLRCDHPTVFGDKGLVAGLKSGSLSPKKLAADTATGRTTLDRTEVEGSVKDSNGVRTETWEILAVNKFDSDRKRMSILLRSPPEFGRVAILFCKGADSAMLDPSVCAACSTVFSGVISDDAEKSQQLSSVDESEDEATEWEMSQMLGIQSHLGEFAKEGLRTLVLGIRFLTDTQCEQWLQTYRDAATSMKDRDGMMKKAAIEIESDLHVVGATAIEDKLQTGVPNTIATLGKAGIKLWVLTGDKRETAIEIGYSTRVLTPRMHLTEVSDKGAEFVRAQCAMEFMRLVKAGKLPLYQRAAVDQSDDSWSWANALFVLGKSFRSCFRSYRKVIVNFKLYMRNLLGFDTKQLEDTLLILEAEQEDEDKKLRDVVRRRNVRNRAEKIIKEYGESNSFAPRARVTSPSAEVEAELSTDDLPPVFNRAQSAKSLLERRISGGRVSGTDKRNLSLLELTAQQVEHGHETVLEEDLLSLNSFYPTSGEATTDFDKRRRTVLERLFAVDRDVRKGRLVKHLKKEKRDKFLSDDHHDHITPSGEGPRALVIEGAALKHLLGDHELEELIFNIASHCQAVIACRVSPRQKALLVKLVRQHVVPEPVTLAIGDGANDVGMIQEAHVGVGISGKEGKQAVNASDFAIAQFRFLEDLVLIHGRWDFMRLATVVLFSFYKNAVMAGCLVVYNGETLFSGTPLFNQWIIAVLNFVAGIPILFFGMFDRCLEKDYIRKNPDVLQPTRQNELITLRILFRWVLLAFAHIFILYYGSLPQLSGPGGMTSAFDGLMRNKDTIGDGSSSDLQSVGTVIFTSMVLLLAYKVLYEHRSIINGSWPALCGFRKNAKEGFFSRLPYTWYGITYGSIFFYIAFLFIYQKIATKGPGEYFQIIGVPPHIFGSSSLNYISMLFVPIFGMAFDLAGKVFSNMFFPTQTQIHVELESRENAERKKKSRNQGQETNVNGFETQDV